MIIKLAEEYNPSNEVKIMNIQMFIDTATNLFKDSTNVLNDPEVQRMVRKEYGETKCLEEWLQINDYYPEYEHKLYDYYEPPLKTTCERVILEKQAKST